MPSRSGRETGKTVSWLRSNPEFSRTDVALVIGASDVTNPAARRPGSAISGMPILDVDHTRHARAPLAKPLKYRQNGLVKSPRFFQRLGGQLGWIARPV